MRLISSSVVSLVIFAAVSPKYFIKLALNCFSSILYRGTKCKMSHTLVWWRLLLCEVRCFVMIFSLGKSLNRTRVKLRELFYMCLLSLVSCQHVNRLSTTLQGWWLTGKAILGIRGWQKQFISHPRSSPSCSLSNKLKKINSLAFYLATSNE